ncbi:two-component system chemotaxis sensor kinase CheA [Bacillus mesophilus]|uniref:Circadian input-output histidine kinase CikA n=1 Tax=Bacillus mesophilus TaxID=1808955 RepID=A0A6M0Q327_9BACI|nr:response regulator [Bacillus mesophilus]MBM7659887.1 two-component system chemotaxis sensor kinase CheA [Bacillus mesophilus]NEY70746.1 response regulator [Bacillus mesophilus]
MNFRTILYTGFGMVIFTMVIVMVIFINTLNHQTHQMNEIVNDRYSKIDISNQIKNEIGELSLGVSSYARLNYKDNKKIQSIRQSFRTIDGSLRDLESKLYLEEAKNQLTILEDHYFLYRANVEEILAFDFSTSYGVSPSLLSAVDEIQQDLVLDLETLIEFQEEEMNNTLSNAEQSNDKVLQNIIITLIVSAILALLMAYIVVRSVTKRLRKIKNVMGTLLDDNHGYQKLEVSSNDEIGDITRAYNEMATTLERQDQLEAQYKEEIENQNWLQSSIAELSLLVQGINDLQTSGNQYVQKLTNFVDASCSVLYLLEKDEDQNEYLKRYATYAFSDSFSDSSLTKIASDRISLGEGIVGQAAQSKQAILMNDLPNDYLHISSGLGITQPTSIMVLPIVTDGELIGVMEIATLKEISPLQKMLLKQACEVLGVTINRIQRHQQVELLLKESQVLNEELQSQSEELQLQQEELRTMNDELEAQNKSSEMKTKELEEIKESLEQRTKEVVNSSKYKSEFMANMSHELRTPLNSLLILAQILSQNKEGNLTQTQLEYSNTIYSSGNDLLQLIDSILDLSKIESGKMDVIEGEVSISELFTQLERQFLPMAKQKGLDLTFNKDKELPDMIFTDEQKINQILKNLLSNALKFTEKGNVRLQVTKTEKEGLEYATFSVIDTGIGIPSDQLPFMFDAFRQADGTTSRKYGGTGLGLSISKELAELLKGYIQGTSATGNGSTFSLYIPLGKKQSLLELDDLRSEEAVTAIEHESAYFEVAATNELEPFKGKKVLVVDDDMRNIFALTSSLEAAGMTVTFAENGQEAIDLLHDEHTVDIILMDIMMPTMDGYEAMRIIRSMDKYKELPIVALTAKAMKDDRQKCIDAGASDYISKPVNLEQLFSIIRVWLHH